MTTTDFAGSYDYERTEAKSEAESFLLRVFASEYTEQENRARANKLLAHWTKVLCAEGLKDFCDEWNKHVKEYPL